MGQIVLESLMQPKLLLNDLPAPSELDDGTIYGNYSIRKTNGFIRPDGLVVSRACLARACRTLPGTRILDTETAFTRCWLKSLGSRKVRKSQAEAFLTARPPQYCHPSVSNSEAFYVDITSAYHSIYSRFSWRMEYLRGKYFSSDSDILVFPFPLEWKSGRSYVVTAALPAKKRIVFGGAVHEYAAHNPYFNSPFVCAVWDVLSAVARFAVDVYGARYFNIDGAVISERNYFGYCEFLDSLGFTYKTKYRGKAQIHNLASWQIGDHTTQRFASSSRVLRHDTVPVTMAEAEWILTRFSQLERVQSSQTQMEGSRV